MMARSAIGWLLIVLIGIECARRTLSPHLRRSR
jgi:hypothetical protein